MILQSFRHFLVFSKIRRERKHSRGHVAHSESTREGSLGSGTRDTWRARATSGGTLPAWVLGTRVALGGFRGKYHSLDPRRTRGFREGPMCMGHSAGLRGGSERVFGNTCHT